MFEYRANREVDWRAAMDRTRKEEDEDLRIDATPEELATAIMSGATPRKEPDPEPDDRDE